MQQTDNLDLELYEATDNANLLDGYNASMRKIDQRDGEISTLITALNTTVTGYDGRITAAQSDATQALADAATADGKAVAAQTDATKALSDLAGTKITYIDSSDFTDWFTIPTGSKILSDTDACYIRGVVMESEADTIMIVHMQLHVGPIATTEYNTALPLINLNGWVNAESFPQQIPNTAYNEDTYNYLSLSSSANTIKFFIRGTATAITDMNIGTVAVFHITRAV